MATSPPLFPRAHRRAAKPTGLARPALLLEALEDRCLPSADVVLEWNAIALDALKNDSLLSTPRQDNPGNASRAMAIVQAAVFDAVNSIDRSYEPYLIQVNAPHDASLTAAAATAAHDTLAALFPEYRPTLDSQLADDLSQGGSFLSRVEGVLVGHFVAATILAVRSHDGSDVMMNWPAGTQPGLWQPDPLHPNQSAWGPNWGNVTPFTLTSSTQFQVPPPPALSSQAYADAYNEVKSLGGDGVTTPTTRTAEQTQIGIFWGYDAAPGVGPPPRMYNQIAETLAVQMHNSVVQNARFFALINLSLADAGIEAWESKFVYDYWRPVTGIRAGNADGNPLTVADPTWTPLGAAADNGSGTNFTPPFPSYVSGHATFGGALFHIMAEFFGRDDIPFTIGSDEFNGVTRDQHGVVRPVVTRSYNSFSQADAELAQSRIYIGVHWQFDAVQGITLGTHVADYVFSHFLLPRSDGGDGPGAAGPSGAAPAAAGRALALIPLGQQPGLTLGPQFSAGQATLRTSAVPADDPAALSSSELLLSATPPAHTVGLIPTDVFGVPWEDLAAEAVS
jgi:membrane-associated phospholipid phosphatase